MSAPLATCGLPVADQEAVAAAGQLYERDVTHADSPTVLTQSANGTAPALIFASTNAASFDIASACEAWRTQYPGAAIVCCGPDDEFSTKLEALDAGADQFLVSPIEEEALEFILRFCLVEQGR